MFRVDDYEAPNVSFEVYLVWEDGGSILVALLNLAIPALQIFLTYTLCLGRQCLWKY